MTFCLLQNPIKYILKNVSSRTMELPIDLHWFWVCTIEVDGYHYCSVTNIFLNLFFFPFLFIDLFLFCIHTSTRHMTKQPMTHYNKNTSIVPFHTCIRLSRWRNFLCVYFVWLISAVCDITALIRNFGAK